jgi:hypothetical protein
MPPASRRFAKSSCDLLLNCFSWSPFPSSCVSRTYFTWSFSLFTVLILSISGVCVLASSLCRGRFVVWVLRLMVSVLRLGFWRIIGRFASFFTLVIFILLARALCVAFACFTVGASSSVLYHMLAREGVFFFLTNFVFILSSNPPGAYAHWNRTRSMWLVALHMRLMPHSPLVSYLMEYGVLGLIAPLQLSWTIYTCWAPLPADLAWPVSSRVNHRVLSWDRKEHNIVFFLALMFPVLAELFSDNVVTLHFKWLLNCSRWFRLASLHSLWSEKGTSACLDCYCNLRFSEV